MPSDSLHIIQPLGYLDFLALLDAASLVLTDSGGIQEETTVLGIPCLTLRENTERPITCDLGTNRLVGSDPKLIVKAAESAIASEWSAATIPYWDGRAANRIADILVETFA